MFLNLILKEFRNGIITSKIKKDNFLNIISTLIVSLAFIVLEIYLYKNLNDKLSAFENASQAFLNIFLFALSVLVILYLTIAVRKTVYSKEDKDNLISKPVSQRLNILSKIVFIYVQNIIIDVVIALPILLIYGSKNHVGSRITFLIILYPLIISIFETGAAFLLSSPFQIIYSFLQKHFIVQVVVSLSILIGLCVLYGKVLNAFLVLVRDNNIYEIFSEESINNLSHVAEYLVPTKYYIQLFNFNFLGLYYIFTISLLIFIFGTILSSKIYLYTINNEGEKKKSKKEKEFKFYSPTKALLKKELALCFEDSNSIFSFSSLLVLQPFLTVLVVQAMNTIFKTGSLSFVISFFPYLIYLIQILFVALFSTFINTAASFVISREKFQGIRICKTIPVSYKTQLVIKMIVPLCLSLLSLITTLIVLLITKQVKFSHCLLSLLFALCTSILLELISVNNDLKNPSINSNKSNKESLISFLSIAIPLVSISLMFLLSYLKLPLVASFFIIFAVLVIATTLYSIYFYKNATKEFVALEMRN